jgi:excisionase family DNA binding protein
VTSLLSPRQFAAAIGVSESSVRRWADGGQIKMTRTAGGHRKIARSEAIRFIRETNSDIVRPDILEIAEPGHRRKRVEAFAAQDEELFEALAAGKADIALGLLTRMYVEGVTAAEICDGPLRSAMRRIGDLWPTNERAIFIEHRASNICIDALNRLRSTFPTPPDGCQIAIGGAPENDPYVLPSLMATTVLSDIGFQAINLGPNTPLSVLADSALELDVKLVWVACTAPLPKAALENDLRRASERLQDRRVQMALGGQALARYRSQASGHVHRFSSMTEMAGFAKALLHPARK